MLLGMLHERTVDKGSTVQSIDGAVAAIVEGIGMLLNEGAKEPALYVCPEYLFLQDNYVDPVSVFGEVVAGRHITDVVRGFQGTGQFEKAKSLMFSNARRYRPIFLEQKEYLQAELGGLTDGKDVILLAPIVYQDEERFYNSVFIFYNGKMIKEVVKGSFTPAENGISPYRHRDSYYANPSGAVMKEPKGETREQVLMEMLEEDTFIVNGKRYMVKICMDMMWAAGDAVNGEINRDYDYQIVCANWDSANLIFQDSGYTYLKDGGHYIVVNGYDASRFVGQRKGDKIVQVDNSKYPQGTTSIIQV